MKKKKEKYLYFFRHFSLRLSERYNILISFEEYITCCNSLLIEAKDYKTNGVPCVHGYIFIQDQIVRVLKSSNIGKQNVLLTALPNKEKIKKRRQKPIKLKYRNLIKSSPLTPKWPN